MERVSNDLTESPILVAFKEMEGYRHHVGVVHRNDDVGSAEFLHLAWHLYLRNEPFRQGYLLVEPGLSMTERRYLASWCRRIAKSNERGIPYGFSAASRAFDQATGGYRVDGRTGLTCASFVLAIFDEGCGPLVAYETWPNRPEDIEWQKEIIALMRSQGMIAASHIEALENEIGAVRYRPAEVVGAAWLQHHPADFGIVKPISEMLLEML